MTVRVVTIQCNAMSFCFSLFYLSLDKNSKGTRTLFSVLKLLPLPLSLFSSPSPSLYLSLLFSSCLSLFLSLRLSLSMQQNGDAGGVRCFLPLLIVTREKWKSLFFSFSICLSLSLNASRKLKRTKSTKKSVRSCCQYFYEY